MGADEPAGKPKHRWLAWLGLQEPPPDPESWVPVATGRVDNRETGASDYASAIVRTLADSGIDAHQRPYVVPDDQGIAGTVLIVNRSAEDRVRVAVLVHARDLERAKPIVAAAPDTTPGESSISEREALFWLGAAPPSAI